MDILRVISHTDVDDKHLENSFQIQQLQTHHT